jgi:hypothetical protein
VVRVGVEGTGSWGVGLSRFLISAGVEVVEVDRPNRQDRRKQGKSDPTDAVSASIGMVGSNRCVCCWWPADQLGSSGTRP